MPNPLLAQLRSVVDNRLTWDNIEVSAILSAPIVFILAPLDLLRVMLDGHPGLFVPPEKVGGDRE